MKVDIIRNHLYYAGSKTCVQQKSPRFHKSFFDSTPREYSWSDLNMLQLYEDRYEMSNITSYFLGGPEGNQTPNRGVLRSRRVPTPGPQVLMNLYKI